MVRLKDYKSTGDADLIKFQFHYGTIKSIIQAVNAGNRLDFNSTMVRLKAVAFAFPHGKLYISIPLWYD